jgi:hypothetical protein
MVSGRLQDTSASLSGRLGQLSPGCNHRCRTTLVSRASHTEPKRDDMCLFAAVTGRAACASAWGWLAIGLVALGLLCGCGSSPQPSRAQPASSAAASRLPAGTRSARSGGTGPARGAGRATRAAGRSSASPSTSPETTGFDVTIAFARCMRAHGVPNFPTPTSRPGLLGPSSGIAPSSPRFEAALNGPCQSLAPPAWVSSGPVNSGRGGGP